MPWLDANGLLPGRGAPGRAAGRGAGGGPARLRRRRGLGLGGRLGLPVASGSAGRGPRFGPGLGRGRGLVGDSSRAAVGLDGRRRLGGGRLLRGRRFGAGFSAGASAGASAGLSASRVSPCSEWIPTASHIGLTPHTIAVFGGFKIQGRTAEAAMKILEDALAIEDAGCFMLEFEAVPARIAKLISEQLTIPTIGIGAGVGCDGQILLCYDLLGVFTDFKPKFTKRYAKMTEVAVMGIKQYIAEVKAGQFPDDDHSYTVNDAEYDKFASLVAKRKHV